MYVLQSRSRAIMLRASDFLCPITLLPSLSLVQSKSSLANCSRYPSKPRWGTRSSRGERCLRSVRTSLLGCTEVRVPCWPSGPVDLCAISDVSLPPGHYERKLKHLNNQKESKRKMKRVGRIDLPQEAFFDLLKSK